MQFFTGSPALSSFRLDKLLTEIKQQIGAVNCISSHFVHFADLTGDLTAAESDVLHKLLEYGPAIAESDCEGDLFLITPRAGTISPWSSKSTDIAHNCGLDKVLRLERGIAYTVGSIDGHQFSGNERGIIASALHDRMTEMVLHDYADAAILFSHAQPQPGETVDVINGGKDALVTANTAMGLALSADEIDYLVDFFTSIARNPGDAELRWIDVKKSTR